MLTNKVRVIITVFLILFSVICIFSQDQIDDKQKSVILKSKLNPILKAIETSIDPEGSPGLALMVIQNGEIVHSSGHGLADLDSKSPLLPSTPIRLASVSKAFTAMAIMILSEQGKLDYDSLATKWIPELNRFKGITIRHLLNHTSGLPDYYTNNMIKEMAIQLNKNGKFSNSEAVSIYKKWGEHQFEAGSRYQYSNPGYEVLGLIVERVSGMTFGNFLKKYIFDPLEMKTAFVRDNPHESTTNRAIGYNRKSNTNEWIKNDDHWANWIVGAGGIYASLDDLYCWEKALYDGIIVKKSSLDEAFLAAVLNDGSASPYGFGWMLSDINGYSAIHHGGSWVGFRTAIALFPDERLTVIVLSNATTVNAVEVRDGIAKTLLDNS